MSSIDAVNFQINDLIGKIDDPYAKKSGALENSLDKEAFLTLLATQLQHQNPLEPMDNQAFVAQMAEFSALEQMQNLNKSFNAISLMQASTILGKEIEAIGINENDRIVGTVKSIRMFENKTYVTVLDQNAEYREVESSGILRISVPE